MSRNSLSRPHSASFCASLHRGTDLALLAVSHLCSTKYLEGSSCPNLQDLMSSALLAKINSAVSVSAATFFKNTLVC